MAKGVTPPSGDKLSLQGHPCCLKIIGLMSKKVPHSDACPLSRFSGDKTSICQGRVGKDESDICMKSRDACSIKQHQQKKAWNAMDKAHSLREPTSYLQLIGS